MWNNAKRVIVFWQNTIEGSVCKAGRKQTRKDGAIRPDGKAVDLPHRHTVRGMAFRPRATEAKPAQRGNRYTGERSNPNTRGRGGHQLPGLCTVDCNAATVRSMVFRESGGNASFQSSQAGHDTRVKRARYRRTARNAIRRATRNAGLNQ